MGPVLFMAAAAGLAWAWWTGRLKGWSYEDAAAAVLFLLGLRLLTTGKILTGSVLMAAALLWAAWRRRQVSSATMSPADARRLLGVSETATLNEIRDAHRRLITRVHPDAGGSAELANRVNVARDTLVAELSRRTPKPS
jgi:DnaJ homolog subfamily C member 19